MSKPKKPYDPHAAIAAHLPPEAGGADNVIEIWRRSLDLNDKGKFVASLRNCYTILANDERWRGVLGFDEFAQQVVKLKPPPFEWGKAGSWGDVDDSRMAMWLSQHYGINTHTRLVREAMLAVADSLSFHPVRDYLKSITWDGKERIEEWTLIYLGAPRSDYTILAGLKWLVAAVARVMRPGCKADNVLILEGPQGRLKSTALAILGGVWFMDTPFVIGDKDAFMVIRGKWIVELAELDGFSRAETSKAKAFFSAYQDTYRAPYMAWTRTVMRQCVFAGTVNHGTYLRDTTGNRRYWPIETGQIDIEAIKRDRDQLWAEAAARYADGTRWWVTEDEIELFAVEQEVREVTDAYEDQIANYLVGKSEVMMAGVLRDGLGLTEKDWTLALQTRVGELLARLGWKAAKRVAPSVDKRRPRIYLREEAESATGNAT
jgi:putative DNA primase/helicase